MFAPPSLTGRGALALVLMALLWAPAAAAGARPQARATFSVPGRPPWTVTLEVANDAPSRARGLMRRPHLGPDAGMIFVWDRARPRTFWMKDTWLSLDLIFLDAEAKVAGIVHRAEPMTLTARSVAAAAQYVVEVNGGQAQAHGIAVGGAPVRLEGL